MTENTTTFPIPSTYSRIVARVAKLQERDLGKLLSGTSLSQSIFMPGDATHISGEQQLRILENGQRLLGAPDFGLRLGQQLQPSAHGPLGYLALSSPDLLSALKALRDYLPVRLPWVAVDLALREESIYCELQFRMPLHNNPSAQITMAEAFSMVMQSFVEAILGRPATEALVTFAHATPEYANLYSDYLHAPFEFASASTSYQLPAHLASTTNASGDDASYRLTQQLCNRLLDRHHAQGISGKICRIALATITACPVRNTTSSRRRQFI